MQLITAVDDLCKVHSLTFFFFFLALRSLCFGFQRELIYSTETKKTEVFCEGDKAKSVAVFKGVLFGVCSASGIFQSFVRLRSFASRSLSRQQLQGRRWEPPCGQIYDTTTPPSVRGEECSNTSAQYNGNHHKGEQQKSTRVKIK